MFVKWRREDTEGEGRVTRRQDRRSQNGERTELRSARIPFGLFVRTVLNQGCRLIRLEDERGSRVIRLENERMNGMIDKDLVNVLI